VKRIGQCLAAAGLIAYRLEEQQRKTGKKERLTHLAGLGDGLRECGVEPVPRTGSQ
jgi:hypothetical protein